MIYLDWASTSPPEPRFLAEGSDIASRCFGNPSSNHHLGREADIKLEEARGKLASVLGASLPGRDAGRRGAAFGYGSPSKGERIVFTSGGSESDAIVLLSILRRRDALRDKSIHIVTTEIEHAAVYEQVRLFSSLGIEASFVKPGADGLISPKAVAEAVRKDTALVAVMAVNNETGAVMPLADIAAAVRAASASLGRSSPPLFHSDGVQALGKFEFKPASLGLSSAAFSSHKLRGPRGIGALWLDYDLQPLALGGGQEGGFRSGTENLASIWAFSRAAEEAEAARTAHFDKARELETRLIQGLEQIPGTIILPEGRKPQDPRYSPYVLSASFPGISGEVFARALSDAGIAVSTGSACSSNGRQHGRRVLEAMGLRPDLAFSAIRISTGFASTPDDIDTFLNTASDLYGRYRS